MIMNVLPFLDLPPHIFELNEDNDGEEDESSLAKGRRVIVACTPGVRRE